MKVVFLLPVLYGCVFAPAGAQPIPIGYGWAKNTVNVTVFRKNSVVSDGRFQYAAFYDSLGYMMVAKRRLGDVHWQQQQTAYKGNVKDAHNIISLMVDGKGYLHLSWDHHSNTLHYCRSVRPGSLEMTQPLPMTGQEEDRVTYPEFYRLRNGDLLFLYRKGVSGNGDMVMNRYHVQTAQWSRVQTALISGENRRNAYWQLCVDAAGVIHLSWVWRESSDVASNHDLCYARSTDGGNSWQKSSGEAYQLPITAVTAEYAWRIPQHSELINQTAMTADEKGCPYIATYWRDSSSQVPQYRLVYLDSGKWKMMQVGARTQPFYLGGTGTKRIPLSRPQVLINQDQALLVFRDEERGSKVSVASCQSIQKGQWTVKDLTSFSVDAWEPSYDTELWKARHQLDLFVQRAQQGDGEGLTNLPPQPVYIIRYK